MSDILDVKEGLLQTGGRVVMSRYDGYPLGRTVQSRRTLQDSRRAAASTSRAVGRYLGAAVGRWRTVAPAGVISTSGGGRGRARGAGEALRAYPPVAITELVDRRSYCVAKTLLYSFKPGLQPTGALETVMVLEQPLDPGSTLLHDDSLQRRRFLHHSG